MRAVQRILDANINRAAEGMRVLEDLARFLLDRKDLCGAIKQCRHEIRSITQSDIAWSRDIGGDVGTTHTTSCEDTREHISDIAAAAGNRCAEALRVIEEILKLDNRGSEIESIRYRMYDHAAEVFMSLNVNRSNQWKCCFVLTAASCVLPWRDTLRQSIDAGCDCIQIREKTMATNALIDHTKEVISIASERDVAIIVNDRVDVAMIAGATGVHLGATDASVKDARQLCSNKLLIGATVHDLSDCTAAIQQGADYLGIGPMFTSTTKPDIHTAGPSLLTAVLDEYPSVNHLAIGGITSANVNDLFAIGCKGIAICDAIASSTTPLQVVLDVIEGAMQPS
jgi:thiamine-phosphate pyrophosphorylase